MTAAALAAPRPLLEDGAGKRHGRQEEEGSSSGRTTMPVRGFGQK